VLIMFGSLAMLNLFIAVIISDFEKLDSESEEQRLINMAEYLTLVEKVVPTFILEKLRVDLTLDICLHALCRDEGEQIFKGEQICKGDKTLEFEMRRDLWNITQGIKKRCGKVKLDEKDGKEDEKETLTSVFNILRANNLNLDSMVKSEEVTEIEWNRMKQLWKDQQKTN